MRDLGALVPLSVLTFGPKTGFLKQEIWLMGSWWGRRVGHGLPNGLGAPHPIHATAAQLPGFKSKPPNEYG